MRNIEISGGGFETLELNQQLDIKELIRETIECMQSQRIGYLQPNFFKGAITNTNFYFSKKSPHRERT